MAVEFVDPEAARTGCPADLTLADAVVQLGSVPRMRQAVPLRRRLQRGEDVIVGELDPAIRIGAEAAHGGLVVGAGNCHQVFWRETSRKRRARDRRAESRS